MIFYSGGVSVDAVAVELVSLRQMIGSSLASIQEDRVAIHDAMHNSIGVIADGLSALKQSFQSLNLWEDCKMSQATDCKHAKMFEFEAVQELPPMVDATDSRVSGLVEKLKFFRSASGFRKDVEKECRENSIDCFFKEVAIVLDCDIVKSDIVDNSLIVKLGKYEFKGKTDILLGHSHKFPLLPIEVKPMKGGLKGKTFQSEIFRTKTQIALQGACFQSQCGDSATQYSCLLTNLLVLYVVQIKSYNGSTISARIFKVVQAEELFVRAVLRAADDNRILTHDLNEVVVGPWICEAANTFDCDRKDPAVSGIPQVPQGSGVLEENLVAGQGGGGNLSMSASEMRTNFERLLPTQKQQKSDIRANFTRAWLSVSVPEHLHDLSSTSHVESTAILCE